MSCFQRRVLLAAGSCLLVGVLGCGGDHRPARVPVSGVVTMGGDPVEGALVTFMPKTPEGEAATGTTDASGKYVLTTFERADGAVPAEYSVKVAKYEAYTVPLNNGPQGASDENVEFSDEAYAAGYDAPEEGEVVSGPKNLLPEKYADPSKSGLEYVVTDGENNTYDITLTK